MHPAAVDELRALAARIEAGLIPESAVPRMFYFGHKLIGEWTTYPPGEKPAYRCVACLKDWAYLEGDRGTVCPHCGARRGSYGHPIANGTAHYRWRCKDCGHEWEGFDGTTCPGCGSVRND